MVAEGEQRADRLGAVGVAGERHRALEVLARLLGVADAAEDAAEDAVRPAGRARLVEALGQAQRLLGGVDREHVVAGVHVERGGLLVEANQLDAGRPVLEQVDPALVVVDRGPRARPCARARRRSCGAGPRRGPGPPRRGDSRGTAPRPRRRRRPGRAEARRRPASRRSRATRPGVERLRDLQRRRVVVEGLRVRVEGGGGVARGLEGLERLGLEPGELVGVEARLRAERRGAGVVLGDQRRSTPSERSPARSRMNSPTSTCFRQRTDLGSIE